jgi:hypothetical protein
LQRDELKTMALLNQITATLLLATFTFTLQPVMAQPAINLPETEVYSRKYISFYLEEPDFSLNQVLINKFRGQMPRFDYHLIQSQIGGELLPFLSQVQRHQREKAGELAASNRKDFSQPEQGELKLGEKVVTWSETQQIAKAAFVFGSHWAFSPVYLKGPTMHIIEENEKGEFKHPTLPGDAYTRIRTVKKKKYNKKTKKDEETDVREFLYWEVGAGTDLSFGLKIFRLVSEPEQYMKWSDSWYIGNNYVVTKADMSAARKHAPKPREFDPEKSHDQAYLLKTPRFQAMLEVEPATTYMDQAVGHISAHNGWFDSLCGHLKKDEAFKLKSEVVELYKPQDRAQASFGSRESADSLGVRTHDWLEQIEWVEQGGVLQKKSLGLVRIRGFYQDDMLVQPIFVPRDLELGDQLNEYNSKNGSFGIAGGYYSFPGQLAGPSLNLNYSWVTETLSPYQFRQRILEKASQNKEKSELELTLAETTGWEWNYFAGATIPLDTRNYSETQKLFLDLHAGLLWRKYERQWNYSLGLAPMLVLSNKGVENSNATDNSENTRETLPEAFGIKLLAGAGYAFGQNFALETQAGLMLAMPYGIGWLGQFQLLF